MLTIGISFKFFPTIYVMLKYILKQRKELETNTAPLFWNLIRLVEISYKKRTSYSHVPTITIQQGKYILSSSTNGTTHLIQSILLYLCLVITTKDPSHTTYYLRMQFLANQTSSIGTKKAIYLNFDPQITKI